MLEEERGKREEIEQEEREDILCLAWETDDRERNRERETEEEETELSQLALWW